MPVRTVNIPDDLDRRLERAVEIRFGNKRSKAYAELLALALSETKDTGFEERLSSLEKDIVVIKKQFSSNGIEI